MSLGSNANIGMMIEWSPTVPAPGALSSDARFWTIEQGNRRVQASDDAEILRSISGGDADALVALYDRYGRLSFGLAYRILGDATAAEEVVQDAFLRVWHQANRFDPSRGSARSWLLSIVHNRAIDLLRGKAGRRRKEFGLDGLEETRSESDVWDEVSLTLQRERVKQAVEILPLEQRRAIEMAYFDGLTHNEISESTGIPLGTIKSRLRLGLKKLHSALVAAGVQGDDHATN